MKNKWLILNGIVLSFILFHSIGRDIEFTRRMPGDLRNRIVGARLQMEGRSPYFYHWHPGDNLRFVDPQNIILDSNAISNVTASPFYHQLLYPICDFSQYNLSWLSFLLQYFMLAVVIFLCIQMTGDLTVRILLINVGVLFTLTEAWKSLISAGQLYFFCALMIACIIYGLLKKNKLAQTIAGICMAAFILIRPISIIALVPLLSALKIKRLFFAGCFLALTAYGLFVLTSPFERYLWTSYRHALQAHVEMHQLFDYSGVPPKFERPQIRNLEGYDLEKIAHLEIEKPIGVFSENGNFFVVYYMITKKRMPLNILYSLTISTLIILLLGYFYVHHRNKQLLIQTLIFSFALYLILELFTPIHRFQYYTVQWFPLVLIGFILSDKWNSITFILLSSGLLLNILNLPWLLMRHTIGEYFWMIALLIISFYPKEKLSWRPQ